MTKAHRRTGEHIAKIVGVVQAGDEEEAKNKAWKLAGSDTSLGMIVQEINLTEGYTFTVYKSFI